MKNKKGFTLVELLAVIALLAILVLLALPNILNVLSNARKESFLIEVKGLDKSIKEKYINETLFGNKISEIDSESDSKLNLEGNELKYKIKLDNKGNVTSITVSNDSYCVDSNKKLSDLTTEDIQDGKCVAVAKCHENTYQEGTLLHAMLKDSCAYPDNMKSKYVSLESGIDFYSSGTKMAEIYVEKNKNNQTISFNSDGYNNRFRKPNSSAAPNESKYSVEFMATDGRVSCRYSDTLQGAAESYTFNSETGLFLLNNYYCLSNSSFNEKSVGGYVCYDYYENQNYLYTNPFGCEKIAKILEIKDGKITKANLYYSEKTEKLYNGMGLYYSTEQNISEDGKEVYFYRGDINNNNVIFNDFCWKIIRTTTNSNIKLIYNGSPSNGVCSKEMVNSKSEPDINQVYSYNKDVEYATDTYSAKKTLDRWYEDNFLNKAASKYLVDETYCNDKKVIPNDVSYNYYSYNRININKEFDMSCPRDEDKYTVSTSNGNGKLKYPLALITVNEGILSGFSKKSIDGINSSYLYTTDLLTTMTPHSFTTHGEAIIYYLTNNIYRDISCDIVSVGGVPAIIRPVITIKSNVEITKGNGLNNNPYVIRVLER